MDMKRSTFHSVLKILGIALCIVGGILLFNHQERSTPALSNAPSELLSQTTFPNDCTASGKVLQKQSFTIGDISNQDLSEGYCCFICIAAVYGKSIAYWWQDFLDDWNNYPKVYVHDANGDSTLLEPDHSHTTIPDDYMSPWVDDNFTTSKLPDDVCSILKSFESNHGILCWRSGHMTLIYGAVLNEDQGTITYYTLDGSPIGHDEPPVAVDAFVQTIQQRYGSDMRCVLFPDSK